MTARALAWLVCAAAVLSDAAAVDFTGVNLAEVDCFQGKGMNIIRLPFRWERLQQSANAEFNTAELNRLNTFVSQTTARGVFVILDPHNYARYYGDVISSAQVPVTAFSNFWSRLASIYRTNDHVIFGLMNESNSMMTSTNGSRFFRVRAARNQ
ncbi:MAG TPA: glycoside hydrolase family 5 protein [Verrucomicrobia bacterium]|nr:glycoside hydrolase family 5 protein [Verrucomicrobiota bacterium]HOB31306.1 cellulase family glycosylhydrolase [Verrucomicrobiota bacterium]HOP97071.1 cellulase family glycosylhydrolase [Verrucomicrobiota bacterium]HPU54657.1 cellulase family glycosylhydrolase [Verrucomicrobiota bacterium]